LDQLKWRNTKELTKADTNPEDKITLETIQEAQEHNRRSHSNSLNNGAGKKEKRQIQPAEPHQSSTYDMSIIGEKDDSKGQGQKHSREQEGKATQVTKKAKGKKVVKGGQKTSGVNLATKKKVPQIMKKTLKRKTLPLVPGINNKKTTDSKADQKELKKGKGW